MIGLVTPGVRVRDRQHVAGVLEFQDMVTAAERWVPEVDALADVVVVIAHTGLGNVDNDAYDRDALHEDGRTTSRTSCRASTSSSPATPTRTVRRSG